MNRDTCACGAKTANTVLTIGLASPVVRASNHNQWDMVERASCRAGKWILQF
jgi:hypothetical protein